MLISDSNFQIIFAYIMLLMIILLLVFTKMKKEKDVIYAAVKMTIQLVIAGYVLAYIFQNPNPIITIFIFMLMQFFCVHTIKKRLKFKSYQNLNWQIYLTVFVSTSFSLLVYILLVLKIDPWYQPSYFIPLSGMIMGNTMTAITLAIKYLYSSFENLDQEIRERLYLGASPFESVKKIIYAAHDNGITPTLNSMMGMGIVVLPGMMTGQIIAGASSTVAVSYQISIMIAILLSVNIATIMILYLAYHNFFNQYWQIRK